MGYSEEELREIFDSTDGLCVYCEKHLVFSNYGTKGKGNWEVAHRMRKGSAAKFFGRDDKILRVFRNLRPACPECNRADQDGNLLKAEIGEFVLGSQTIFCHCGKNTPYHYHGVKYRKCEYCGGKLPTTADYLP